MTKACDHTFVTRLLHAVVLRYQWNKCNQKLSKAAIRQSSWCIACSCRHDSHEAVQSSWIPARRISGTRGMQSDVPTNHKESRVDLDNEGLAFTNRRRVDRTSRSRRPRSKFDEVKKVDRGQNLDRQTRASHGEDRTLHIRIPWTSLMRMGVALFERVAMQKSWIQLVKNWYRMQSRVQTKTRLRHSEMSMKSGTTRW